MKKSCKYYLSPDQLSFCMSVEIDGKPSGCCFRYLVRPHVVTDCLKIHDLTTHDLVFHAFMRLSHQYIVDKDSLDVKIGEMFELENPNLV